jgi:Flp pilus assembly protein TadB
MAGAPSAISGIPPATIPTSTSTSSSATGSVTPDAQILLDEIDVLYRKYLTRHSNQTEYNTQTKTLKQQEIELSNNLQELKRQEQIYDREFLDRKQTPPPKGLLASYGIRSTQDHIFIFLLFSYVMFSLLLLILVLIYSTKRLIAAAAVITMSILIGVLSTVMIYWYG